MSENIVIIGGGVAGMSLAAKLMRAQGFHVTVIKKEVIGSYSPCGMPFVLEGKVGAMEDILLRDAEFFRQHGVDMRTGQEVNSVDLEAKTVHLTSGDALKFDRVVFATGSSPFVPPIPGTDKAGVHTLGSYKDGEQLLEAMTGKQKAVVVGAGAIGLESAVAFTEKGIDTTVVEMLPTVLPTMLDRELAEDLEKRLVDKGIHVLCNSKVEAIEGDVSVSGVTVEGETLDADLVLLAVGIRPNVGLAKGSGLDIGPRGGILVNEGLGTSKGGNPVPGIYALGDCAEVRHELTGSTTLAALASTISLEARILAMRLMNKGVLFNPVTLPAITYINDLFIGSVGLTSHLAERIDMKPRTGQAKSPSHSHYYPGATDLTVRVIADGERLIGVQAICRENLKGLMDQCALALGVGLSVKEFYEMERSYAPPAGLLTDALTNATEQLL